MRSSGRDDRPGPDACVEHVWTDAVLTFTDDGAWVEQRCRLCGQIQLLGPEDSTALTTWYDAISLREHRRQMTEGS